MRAIAAIVIALGLLLWPQPLAAFAADPASSTRLGPALGDDDHPLLIAPVAAPCVVIGQAVPSAARTARLAIERWVLIGLSLLFGVGFALYYVGSWAHCQDLALCAALLERARIRRRLSMGRGSAMPRSLARRTDTRLWLAIGQRHPWPPHLNAGHPGLATPAL